MQSDIVKIFVLGDFDVTKRYLHRLVFGDTLSLSEENANASSFPYNTHTSSYLLDNKRCYTLQFWEICKEEDIRNLEKPDIFLMLFDISKRSSFTNMTRLQQHLKLNISNSPLLVIATKKDLLSQTDGL